MQDAKINLPPFHYSQICLRLLTEDCLKETLTWRNFYRECFNDNNEVSLSNHLLWYQRYKSINNDFVFIVENKQQIKVGQTSIYNIDWNKQIGEFGRIVVNPAFAGQSYMKNACEATLKLAVEILKLQLIHLNVKKNNFRAIELYKNCGFKAVAINGNEHLQHANMTMMFKINRE